MSTANKSIENIFEKYIDVNDGGCWIYNGAPNQKYAKVSIKGKSDLLHRMTYRMFVGQIKDGMFIDHLCEVKKCVNPFHLEQVSNKENIVRYYKNKFNYDFERTCVKGHDKSLYFVNQKTINKNGNSYQTGYCKECHRLRTQKYRLEGRQRPYVSTGREYGEALRKPVSKYLNGKLIGSYISIAEAGRENNMTHSNIVHNLQGKTRSAGGFTWGYDK